MVGFFAVAAIFAIAGPAWPWVKRRLWRRFAVSIASTASDFRYWLGALALLFVFLEGPDIYRSATGAAINQTSSVSPSTKLENSQDAVDVTKMPTSLRVLFKHNARPEEIQSKNLTWTWMIPTEHLKNPDYVPGVGSTSPPPLLYQFPPLGAFTAVPPQAEYIGVNTWMIILIFNHPVSYKTIKIDDHGAKLPAPEMWKYHQYAVVWFHSNIDNDLIDFVLSDTE